MSPQRRKPRASREKKHVIVTTAAPLAIEVSEIVLEEPTMLIPLPNVEATEEKENTVCACGGVCKCAEREDSLLDIVKPLVCTCVDYDGQDYFCKVHAPSIECPRCHCVNTAIEILPKMVSIINYKCPMCGIFFYRNEETGIIVHH